MERSAVAAEEVLAQAVVISVAQVR